jgi:hypothetical protein
VRKAEKVTKDPLPCLLDATVGVFHIDIDAAEPSDIVSYLSPTSDAMYVA